tara:strand:+ start:6934 stop:7233 length:300 start_codon:yes stop_codon:yes gene_type:complete
MIKTTTDCCALCQLSRVNNDTPKYLIQWKLDQLTKEMLANKEVGITTGNGQTSVFTIVSPGENELEKNLISLGFENKHEFERRIGYPNTGSLKMYIKNL